MNRRRFLINAGRALLVLASPTMEMSHAAGNRSEDSAPITLFLCGDVMTGRGVDQVLPHPGDPRIHEPHMRSAAGYVELADEANGPIPRPVGYRYIWGEALRELERAAPDVRIINLETSVTTSEERVDKGINYRMHPDNIPCITAARIDCCVLANNHVLDWGYRGLFETLETLRKNDLRATGAGRNLQEAEAPSIIQLAGKRRVIVFSLGSTTSGIPWDWAASGDKPGVNLLENLSEKSVRRIGNRVQTVKRKGDLVVVSIHWGPNWGYSISRGQREFARKLVAEAGVDIVHGHSSHHAKGIEVYEGKPILYGCGDFLSDYEGIRGYEQYRGDLSLMYLVTMDPLEGRLVRFEMIPFQLKRFSLHRASKEDARWLRDTLGREGRELGTGVQLTAGNTLSLTW